jgi:hypothetical protein
MAARATSASTVQIRFGPSGLFSPLGNAGVPGTFFLDKNLSNGVNHRFHIRVVSVFVSFVVFLRKKVPGTKFLDKNLSNGAGTFFVPGVLPLR